MDVLGELWATEVVQACDPFFEAADVGFVGQVGYAGDQKHEVVSLLWEADPQRFADRYPESGIVETYGEDQWRGVHCIDFWVNLDQPNRRCRLSAEGWNLPELWLDLRGVGAWDGPAIADTFARILGVTPGHDSACVGSEVGARSRPSTTQRAQPDITSACSEDDLF